MFLLGARLCVCLFFPEVSCWGHPLHSHRKGAAGTLRPHTSSSVSPSSALWLFTLYTACVCCSVRSTNGSCSDICFETFLIVKATYHTGKDPEVWLHKNWDSYRLNKIVSKIRLNKNEENICKIYHRHNGEHTVLALLQFSKDSGRECSK